MKHLPTVLALLLSAAASQAQTVVFDTTGGADFSALTTSNNQRYADDVTLAGAGGETIGQIDISILLQEDNTTADVYAYLFDASGTGGSPGAAPLWSSSVLAYDFTAFEDVVSFTVPNIAVPQNFFWAVEFRNIVKLADDGVTPLPNAIFGPQISTAASAQPAGTSTSGASFYLDTDGANGPAGFNSVSIIGADSTFAVKIYNAVPEPAAASLLALGGAGVALLLRRRRRA